MAKLCIVTSLADSCYFRHYSVWANGLVYHFNESGAHCQTEAEFMAKRKMIREMDAIKSDEEVAQYYEAHRNSQYKSLTYNCEHFAYECAMGRKQSPSVMGYTLIAVIAMVISIGYCWIRKRKR